MPLTTLDSELKVAFPCLCRVQMEVSILYASNKVTLTLQKKSLFYEFLS